MSSIPEYNLQHKVSDAINKAHSVSENAYKDIVANVNSNLRSQVDHKNQFIGIDIIGLQTLKKVIEDYIIDIQEKVNEFHEDGDLSVAFAGAPLTAAKEFVKAMKSMLNAYVSTLRMEKDEIDEAMGNYYSAAGQINKAIMSDAESIRGSAHSINLDPK